MNPRLLGILIAAFFFAMSVRWWLSADSSARKWVQAYNSHGPVAAGLLKVMTLGADDQVLFCRRATRITAAMLFVFGILILLIFVSNLWSHS